MNPLLTPEQLRRIYTQCPESRIQLYTPLLVAMFEEFQINTPQRIRMFLAQIGHESGQLRYTEELASGKAYEARRDLGNTVAGDGVRYKGRGLLQITGRSNYSQCAVDLGLPLVENPELLAQPEPAARSAGWYWNKHNLNSLCDQGLFELLTRRINGGLNGYPSRRQLYNMAFDVIK